MKYQNRILPALLMLIVMMSPFVADALDSERASYIGGTMTGLVEGTEGTLDTKGTVAIAFVTKGATLTIPYASISGLEYGQKAGRRVAVAILVSPVALFSKKRKHFLTVNFKDTDGKDQAAVFELGKDIVRTTLTVVETRSGKKIEYQDDEARKAGRG